ncbi:MAG: FHA domain-containing protein [Gammaproteobacteria bacterium]|nr:FHA domain-containing protein [Gammaproteobacteria bacterium]
MPSNDRMAHAPPMIVCLTGDAPRNFPLRRASVTIGRGAGCDIQIATHFVSREHARLTVHGGQVRIEDLGSKNGVFVNAVRVERETLRHGDLITVGESQFRFMAE